MDIDEVRTVCMDQRSGGLPICLIPLYFYSFLHRKHKQDNEIRKVEMCKFIRSSLWRIDNALVCFSLCYVLVLCNLNSNEMKCYFRLKCTFSTNVLKSRCFLIDIIT